MAAAVLTAELVEKYGAITSVNNIQLSNCVYDICATTKKVGSVYFSTGGGYDDYRYSPETTEWGEHVFGGLTADRFRDTPFVLAKGMGSSRRYKSLVEKLGEVKSINVVQHWKYEVQAHIWTEKLDTPISVNLSLEYDDYCSIDTYETTWEAVIRMLSKDDIIDLYEKL